MISEFANSSTSQQDVGNDQLVTISNQSNLTKSYISNNNRFPNSTFKGSVHKMSLPNLDQGEIPMRPGTRLRIKKHHKTSSVIKQKIEEFRVLQRDPPTIGTSLNVQHDKVASNLSEGCLPRLSGSQQDIAYLARARQYQQVIRFLLRRDRVGLMNYSTRIDLAGLIGIPDVDPDNLQLIELSNGVPLIMGRGQAAPRRPRGHVGIPQMVAAGMIPVGQVRQNHQEREQRRILRFSEDLRIIESAQGNSRANVSHDGSQRRNQGESSRSSDRSLARLLEDGHPIPQRRTRVYHNIRRRSSRRHRHRASERYRNRNTSVDVYDNRDDDDADDDPESTNEDQ